MTQVDNLVAVWQAHRRTRGAPPKAVPSRFHADCVISYVPTGVVYRGHREIEMLLDQIRTTYFYIEETKVLSTIYGENDVVEESLLTIRHERPIDYLLPGVKDTGRVLTVAMCTVSTFHGDKLASQRVYWDHASLLRQAGILPQSVRGRNGGEVTVKVAGNEVGNVVNAAFANLGEVAEKQSEGVIEQRADVSAFDEKPLRAQPVQVEVPQELPIPSTASRDTSFKHQETAPAPSVPDVYGNAEVLVANRQNPVTGNRQSVRLYAPPGGISQFSLAGDTDVTTANRQRFDRNSSQLSFGNDDTAVSTPAAPSNQEQHAINLSARSNYAARNRGSLGFGNDQSPERPVTAPSPAQSVPDSLNAGNAPPVTGKRVSVRLHAPPGGMSQISFG